MQVSLATTPSPGGPAGPVDPVAPVAPAAPVAPFDPSLPHPKKRSGRSRERAIKDNIDFLIHSLHEIGLSLLPFSHKELPSG
ncbi:MAG: hypothetical protein FIA93_06035 [Deltaproteobacteria bacterium]|nr:hypothetical protein [Deltaproteobacteria bacterium]